MNVDLQKERSKSSFKPEVLTHLIDGGTDKTTRRRWLRSLIEADPTFSNEDSIFLPHAERYKRALAKCSKLDNLIHQHRLNEEECQVLRACSAEDLPTLLHDL